MESIKKASNFLNDYNFSRSKFLEVIKELTSHHIKYCPEYKSIVNKIFSINLEISQIKSIEDIPYIPVNIFKKYDLKSINDLDIFKILKSSGTTGQRPSKIFLDKTNVKSQSFALSKIFNDFTGLKRPRIIIIDNPELLKLSSIFSARSAGIRGFSSLCRKPIFALDEDMKVNLKLIEETLMEHDENFILYGFTYIIWLHFLKIKFPKRIRDLLAEKATLIHGGGWKKLKDLKISKELFKKEIKLKIGIEKIYDYYGMVEQTGSIFMECSHGFLHTNPLAEVISRSQNDLKNIATKNVGLAQVISCLPTSYPGHSILTDDLIKIHGVDNCKCGRKGKYFEILGRLEIAEPRGCSDTYESPKS